ncbi:MAG: YifB family Mg chelatase-like AAA ATPase [Victivallaceae bacterium]|nr:YifB family Mg chelatase-like AAA ATPase [Victivallaceae bacterium]
MLARTHSAAIVGIDAFPVEIEVNLSGGRSAVENLVNVVGLPDLAVRESRDRVRSAIASSGFPPLKGNAVVNLAPADLHKEGAGFDLGIALAMLAAAGVVDPDRLIHCAVLGELALTGEVRPVRGALPAAARLRGEHGIEALLVPENNSDEAAVAAGNQPAVFPVSSLRDAVDLVNNGGRLPHKAIFEECADQTAGPDFADVKGQKLARRALEIAAAGGHNLLMIGEPGTGKSMLAARLPGILPPLTFEETVETSRIHSVLGMLSSGRPLLNRRPFRAPHHTISDAGLIGGGRDPRPGEISLAHNGVLFLDELPEFKRNVLEVLRQPLETGEVIVSRAAGSCTFPARFMLCAAMNPCPCGRGKVELGCTCKPEEKRRYLKRISGPLLDRIDLRIQVGMLSREELLSAPDGEPSAAIRERVVRARQIQRERFAGRRGFYCNAQLTGGDLRKFCAVGESGLRLLRGAIDKFQLSPRAYDRILKTARTIADLAGSETITDEHLFEAVNYRQQL